MEKQQYGAYLIEARDFLLSLPLDGKQWSRDTLCLVNHALYILGSGYAANESVADNLTDPWPYVHRSFSEAALRHLAKSLCLIGLSSPRDARGNNHLINGAIDINRCLESSDNYSVLSGSYGYSQSREKLMDAILKAKENTAYYYIPYDELRFEKITWKSQLEHPADQHTTEYEHQKILLGMAAQLRHGLREDYLLHSVYDVSSWLPFPSSIADRMLSYTTSILNADQPSERLTPEFLQTMSTINATINEIKQYLFAIGKQIKARRPNESEINNNFGMLYQLRCRLIDTCWHSLHTLHRTTETASQTPTPPKHDAASPQLTRGPSGPTITSQCQSPTSSHDAAVNHRTSSAVDSGPPHTSSEIPGGASSARIFHTKTGSEEKQESITVPTPPPEQNFNERTPPGSPRKPKFTIPTLGQGLTKMLPPIHITSTPPPPKDPPPLLPIKPKVRPPG